MAGARRIGSGAIVAITLGALLACTTPPPSAPRPVVGIAAPVRSAKAASAAAAAPAASGPAAAASAPGAVAYPVTGSTAGAPAAVAPSAVTPPVPEPGAFAPVAIALDPPEVAARFPEPAATPRTPAFAPGRAAFTSNAELQQALRALVREPGAGDLTSDAPSRPTVRLLALGTSQRGEPLEALLFTRLPDTDPDALARSGRPALLLVGGQHGDEPASTEALLAVAQELAGGRYAGWLDRLNVVVLPRANPDGAHDGRRGTANGIDMNRDHLLLRTPEAQAVARLARDYRPAVVVDAHEYAATGGYVEKFGTLPRSDALLQYATTANVPDFVTRAAEEWFRRPLLARLKAEGLTADWYHTTSADVADRKVSMGGVLPDTGRNVHGLRNAVSVLVETRGVGLGRQHDRRRVHTHVAVLASVLQSAHERAADLVKLRQFVEAEVSALACQGAVVVEAAPTPSEYPLQMLDARTGVERTVTVAWDSALALTPVKSRTRPCGYWLAASQTAAAATLRALGVAVQQLAQDGDLRVETYRETAREALRPAQLPAAAAADAVRLTVQTVPALIDVPAGSYYVGLDQPLAHLVVAALEPDAPAGFVANRVVDRIDAVARVMTLPAARMSPLP